VPLTNLITLLLGAGAQGPQLPAVVDAGPDWERSFEIYATDPPDEDAYAMAVLQADRGPLHLEARYNYEDFDTVSFFVGGRVGWEGALSGSAVPMIALVGGRTQGLAPGLELEVDWRSLWLTSQSEYMLDLEGSAGDFFFVWNELGSTFLDHWNVGLVGQRTRLYGQAAELDTGLLAGWSGEAVGLTLYLFRPGLADAYGALSLDFAF